MTKINGNFGVTHLPEHTQQSEGGRGVARPPSPQRSLGVLSDAPPLPRKPPELQARRALRFNGALPNAGPPALPPKPPELQAQMAAEFHQQAPKPNAGPPALPPKPPQLQAQMAAESHQQASGQQFMRPAYQSVPQRPGYGAQQALGGSPQRPPATHPPLPSPWENDFKPSTHGRPSTSGSDTSSLHSSHASTLSLNHSPYSSTTSLSSSASSLHGGRPAHHGDAKPNGLGSLQSTESRPKKTGFFGKLKDVARKKWDEHKEMHAKPSGGFHDSGAHDHPSNAHTPLTGGYGDGRWDRR